MLSSADESVLMNAPTTKEDNSHDMALNEKTPIEPSESNAAPPAIAPTAAESCIAATNLPPAVSACAGTLRATHADQMTGTGPTTAPHMKISVVVARADPPNAKTPRPDATSASGRRIWARYK